MKFFKTIREGCGKSRYELAKLFEMPQTTIASLERSGQGIPFRYLLKLKEISGLSWSEVGSLIEGEFGGKTTRKKR